MSQYNRSVPGSGGAAVETLTGDSGGAVGPNGAFNISILGTSTQGLSFAGNPGISTLTGTVSNASSTQKGVASFNATNFTSTAGVVTSNNFTITAGTGMSGGGSLTLGGSVTLNAGATIPTSFVTDSGTATPALNSLTVAGSSATGIATSASGSTVTVAGIASSTTQVGTVQLATTSEATIGTNATKAVTPAGLNAKLGNLTSNGVAIGAGASNAMSYQTLTDGQLLIGATALNPLPGTIGAGSNMLVTNGPHTISVAVVAAPSFSAISLGTPLGVASGGTGNGSLTLHGHLYGNATTAISASAEPSNGQLAIGKTGDFPSLGTIGSSGNLTVTNGAGTISIGDSATPTYTSMTLTNPLTVPNGGLGVATLASNGVVYGNGAGVAQVTAAGSTGQILIATTSSAPSWGNLPKFSAVLSASQSNVTGDGTTYTIPCNTEIFDVGNNYSSPTFTAPSTGKYWLGGVVTISGMTASHTNGKFQIVTNARTYYGWVGSAFAQENSGSALTIQISCLADMTASDTAQLKITINNGTKVISVFGDGSPQTGFWGFLVA